MRIWTKAPLAAATTLALTLAVAGSVGVAPVGATPVVAAAPSATGSGAGTATSTGTDGRVDLIQATSSAGVAAPRSLARSVQSPAAVAAAHVGTYARALDVDPATLSYEQTAATAAGDSVRFGQSVADVPCAGQRRDRLADHRRGDAVHQLADHAARRRRRSRRCRPPAARDYRALAATTVALREHRRDAGALDRQRSGQVLVRPGGSRRAGRGPRAHRRRLLSGDRPRARVPGARERPDRRGDPRVVDPGTGAEPRGVRPQEQGRRHPRPGDVPVRRQGGRLRAHRGEEGLERRATSTRSTPTSATPPPPTRSTATSTSPPSSATTGRTARARRSAAPCGCATSTSKAASRSARTGTRSGTAPRWRSDAAS